MQNIKKGEQKTTVNERREGGEQTTRVSTDEETPLRAITTFKEQGTNSALERIGLVSKKRTRQRDYRDMVQQATK